MNGRRGFTGDVGDAESPTDTQFVEIVLGDELRQDRERLHEADEFEDL